IQTGLAIVDDQYGYYPEPAPDRFSDPDFNPIYSEDSHQRGTDHALIGSAENYNFNNKDDVKMVSVKPEDYPRSRAESHEATPKFLRKLSMALSSRSRANSESQHDDIEKDGFGGLDRVNKNCYQNPSLDAVTEESTYSTYSTVTTNVEMPSEKDERDKGVQDGHKDSKTIGRFEL
ncbi:hypothetical protein OESDEN_06041, partial [Oesophagostomum dentatum]